jgi:hypothetical protein
MQPSNLCLGFKQQQRRNFMPSEVDEAQDRLSFILTHFEPDSILKLALFGFVFWDAESGLVFIILCGKDAYVHLDFSEIGFVLHNYALSGALWALSFRTHSAALRAGFDAESRTIKMSGFLLSQE